MKPIQLTMTAFGPYKNKEVIRFGELNNHRLFVVSGKTGAGKTTIFDAICYALYGEASGEDRQETKLMRSQFAEGDTHTSVELVFELRSRIYRILRQMAHVKPGNKTATGDRYEFFEQIDGKEVPCVDRQMVSEINQKVEGLLGLTKDQFSQIVMIPQGEFRKLLTSETENKEEILRRIFRTEPYRSISERLNVKRKETEEAYLREQRNLESFINHIHALLPKREESSLFEILAEEHYNIHQIAKALDQEGSFYQETMIQYQKAYVSLLQTYDKELDHFHKMKAINEEFKKWDAKKLRQETLLAKLPTIKDKEHIYHASVAASGIYPYEMQVLEWREELNKKELVKQSAMNNEKQKQNELEASKLNYEKEASKQAEREQLKREIEHFKKLYPEVKSLDDKQKELTLTARSMKQYEGEVQKLNKKLREQKSIKSELGGNIINLDEKVQSLPEKKERIYKWREYTRILLDYLKSVDSLQKSEIFLKERQAEYQEVKNRTDLLEREWLEGQAGLIASKLHHGEVCPVCGSTSHPNKAIVHGIIPTKEQLDEAKNNRQKSETSYHKALAEVSSVKERINEKRHELEQVGLKAEEAKNQFEQFAEKGKRLKLEVTSLEKEQEHLIHLRKSLNNLDKEIEELLIQKDKAELAYQDKKTTYETQKALYQQSLNNIPEEIRELSELEQKIRLKENQLQTLERDWKMAEESLQKVKEALTKATSEYQYATVQLNETKEKREKAEKELQLQIAEAGFESEEDYLKAKCSKEERAALKDEIDKYYAETSALDQQIKELEQSLSGEKRADLNILEEQLQNIKGRVDQAEANWKQAQNYLRDTQNLKKNILDASLGVHSEEQKLQRITDLYDMVRGQNNKKVSFERYLQIEYLERIVQSANERLKKISNGQFTLIRSDRQEARGKQSGLGLDVYDAYTGQTRDVKSLSGGEKFHASLCLALGMADIIQSYQGGVSIDTMFIDEGFGSLDEESLTKAVDTLIELQKTGRMIGVISHVQELKNAIPAILEVEKTKEGYSQARFKIR